MDAERFDRATRLLQPRTRRGTLLAWLAAVLGAAAPGSRRDAARASGSVPLGGTCAAAGDCAPASFTFLGTVVVEPICAEIGIRAAPGPRC